MSDPAESSSPIRKPAPPVVTWLAVFACVCIYLGLLYANDYRSPDTLRRWGVVSEREIWNGDY